MKKLIVVIPESDKVPLKVYWSTFVSIIARKAQDKDVTHTWLQVKKFEMVILVLKRCSYQQYTLLNHNLNLKSEEQLGQAL